MSARPAVQQLQVLCVSKESPAQDELSLVGGWTADGLRWRLSADEAIQGVEAGLWELFVYQARRIPVVVSTQPDGKKQLQAGREEANLLLDLPSCA